jgi:hypothetical protein
MSTELGPLYHWSPRERLSSIKRLGLMPRRRNHHDHYAEYINSVTGKSEVYRQDSVSFSTTPATAWMYSHGAWKSVGTFDLWEVYLLPSDEVHVSPMWGDRIIEVRVRNRIKKSRLVWVGERTVAPI